MYKSLFTLQRRCLSSLGQSLNVHKSKKMMFMFSGVGSQHVGMCKDMASEFKYIARFLEECDEFLKYKMSAIMWESDKKLVVMIFEIGGYDANDFEMIRRWRPW